MTRFCSSPESSTVVITPTPAPQSTRGLPATSRRTVSMSRLSLIRRLASLSFVSRSCSWWFFLPSSSFVGIPDGTSPARWSLSHSHGAVAVVCN